MKSKFESRKTRLREAVRDFGAAGDWIRPPARRQKHRATARSAGADRN